MSNNARDTVESARDMGGVIREFKVTRAVNENIKVKLKGFKKAYELENTPELKNHVTFESYYDVAKRVMVKKEKFKEVYQN